jgi:thiamine-phosphate pyrophosphorylase
VLVSAVELEDATALDITRDLVDIGPSVAVHLRARVSAALLFDVARDLAARAWASGAWCVVNGRPDVALAAGAQAVQLGRTALPIRSVRGLLPHDSGVRIGASVHGSREAEVAVEDGASYVVAGTAYPTPSHPGFEGIGAAGIAAVIRAVQRAGPGRPLPVLAIGGVDGSRLAKLVSVGVSGVVVGRAVWGAADPVVAARLLIDGLRP